MYELQSRQTLYATTEMDPSATSSTVRLHGNDRLFMPKITTSILALLALVVTACGGGTTTPDPPFVPPPPMTQGEADRFATSLVLVTTVAMTACIQKGNFRPNSFGTFPINFSCDATRTCTGSGSIRPSLTETGQVFVNANGVTLKAPVQGSQNILDWGCAGNYIISGNPTVSLTGELYANSATGQIQNYIDHSGQIVYGPSGGAAREQQYCSISLRTIETNVAALHTTGTICGRAISQ